MMRALAIWLAASALGVALIAFLPEQMFGGGDLFRLSERHGPSLSDGLGLLVVLGGWFFYIHALWSRRRTMPPIPALALVVLTLISAASCIAAFAADIDGLAIALAMMAVLAQIGLALLARRA